MCEFKIIKQNDGSQILEDILVISYSENNELLFKDVLGMVESLDSALILDVNTLNQKCTIIEHPIIKHFLKLLHKIEAKQLIDQDVDFFNKELQKCIV
jgi:predicted RNA-binding protein